MTLGLLRCDPLSVAEVIEHSDFDGQYVAVRGILYYGERSNLGEFLLLPKDGSFDGVWPIPMPKRLDRGKCLLVDQPDLEQRLGKRGVAGAFIWKDDAVIVGQIRRRHGSRHPVRIGNLWLLVLQHWLDLGAGSSHEFRVVTFPQANLPPLPWSGFKADRHVAPVLDLFPAPNGTIATQTVISRRKKAAPGDDSA